MKFRMTEAAKFLGITRQGLYVAVRTRRVKFSKEDGRYYFTHAQLDEYRAKRWNRDSNYTEEEISPTMAAEILCVPVQKIYHMIRCGLLKVRKPKGYFLVDKNFLQTLGKVEHHPRGKA